MGGYAMATPSYTVVGHYTVVRCDMVWDWVGLVYSGITLQLKERVQCAILNMNI